MQSKIPKRTKGGSPKSRDRFGSPEPSDSGSALPANPLNNVQRKKRRHRTQITREIAFAEGRSAARDEYHEKVTGLEATVASLEEKLARSETTLSAKNEELAVARAEISILKDQLRAAQLLLPVSRPPICSPSPYLPSIPRKPTN